MIPLNKSGCFTHTAVRGTSSNSLQIPRTAARRLCCDRYTIVTTKPKGEVMKKLKLFLFVTALLLAKNSFSQNFNSIYQRNVIAPLSFKNSEVKKDPSDLVVGSGLGGYFVGGFCSYQLMRSLGLKDTTLTVKLASGILIGASITSATAVYIANRQRGNLALMTGGAILSQVGSLAAGFAFGFVISILDKETGAWMTLFGVLGLPFAATLTANYICYKTK